jgi:HSP20 family molecular chaperone IbpA
MVFMQSFVDPRRDGKRLIYIRAHRRGPSLGRARQLRHRSRRERELKESIVVASTYDEDDASASLGCAG